MKGVWGRKIPPAGGMRLSDRVLFRPGCGRAADRDHNAPLDILKVWEPPLEPWSSALYPRSAGKAGQ
jgi:transposase